MKTISTIGLLFLAAFALAALAQTPTVSWNYETKDSSFGQSVSGDIDGDGKPEIVFGCYRNDSSVYALNAEDGSLLWKRNTGGCNDAGPTIYDVDGDGDLEVIVASSCVAATFCLNGLDGSTEWQTPADGSDSPPTIGDVDGDGKPEILHGEFGGDVMCLNGEDGSVLWDFAVDPNSWIQTEPALLDLDNNGQLDFFVANWSFGTNHKFFAFRGNDHSLLWEKSYPNDYMYHGAAFGDIDLDGKPELVIGSYNDTVYAMNGEDGSLCWKYSYNGFGYVGAPTSIADLDKDGLLEIVFVSYYKVVVLSNTGGLKWHYSIPGYETSFRGAAISDINGDDSLDVVFGTTGGDLTALRGSNGQLLWTVDLQAVYGDTLEFDHAPLIFDFNNDGNMDVFIQGGFTQYPNYSVNYGCAYALDLHSPGGPDWPMFRRDIVRSACVCDSSGSGLQKHEPARAKMSVYPNPTSGKFRVAFSQFSGDRIIIRLLDAAGRSCSEENLVNPQKPFSRDLDLTPYNRGIYFLVAGDGNAVRSARIIRE
jgi:outer membrane protein assembly factor BamB